MEVLKSQKIANIFICEKCDYKCCNKFDFNKHLVTSKHQTGSIWEENCDKLSQPSIEFSCMCGKTCKTHGGMWKHKKKCDIFQQEQCTADDNMIISLVMEVMKNNSELQKQNDDFKNLMVEQNNKMMETMQEVCKNNNTTSINTGPINSHNKTFNLNVFLNEQCKDAMNIMEFVDSIKLDLKDAESVRKLGYVNGISNIIIKHLKALDVHMRPVHCTDLKRETVYVKYQDVWEKEGDDNKLMRKAIKHVAVKNYNAADIFKELHPDCMNWDSKHGDHFAMLRIEALGGKGNINIYDSHTKIIKKIAKEITIDKNS
jgi:hypothetical protein